MRKWYVQESGKGGPPNDQKYPGEIVIEIGRKVIMSFSSEVPSMCQVRSEAPYEFISLTLSTVPWGWHYYVLLTYEENETRGSQVISPHSYIYISGGTWVRTRSPWHTSELLITMFCFLSSKRVQIWQGGRSQQYRMLQKHQREWGRSAPIEFDYWCLIHSIGHGMVLVKFKLH